MGEIKSGNIKIFLFSGYQSSCETIEHLLNNKINLVGALFSPVGIQRLGWRERIKNLLCFGSFKESKRLLEKAGVPVYFVPDYNGKEAEEILKKSTSDVLLIYGTKIIKPNILAIPKIGALNAHSSLLPKYRGSKAEFWMLLNNEPQYAGVTIHWVTPGLDEGDIFLQKPLRVEAGETPETLRKKSRPLAGELFSEAIRRIEEGEISRIKQDESLATKFGRPSAEDLEEFKKRHV